VDSVLSADPAAPSRTDISLAQPWSSPSVASEHFAQLHGLPVRMHVGDAEVFLDGSTRFAARARRPEST